MYESNVQGSVRLALVQFRPRKARPEHNLELIREHVAARAGSTDVVAFAEASLSGYFLEGAVGDSARSVDEVAAGLGAPPESGPDVVVGFYERWRRRLYNSAAWFTPDGEGYRPVHVHRKLFLPTYGLFDEERFVSAGHELEAFDTRFGRFGMLVCEDVWHSLPGTALALGGAEAILVLSASPVRELVPGHDGLPGSLARWDRILRSTAEEHGVWVANVQLVGSEGGKLLPGGAVVVAPDGEVVARGPLLDEGVVEARLDGRRMERARARSPLLSDLERMLPHLQRSLAGRRRDPAASVAPPGIRGGGDPASGSPRPEDAPGSLDLHLPLVEEALVRFIREEVRERRGFEKVVLGVSGGVDSAVSLLLACRALGPENVTGFRLPYATSSPESLEHADLVLDQSGACSRTIEITPMVDAYLETHEPEADPTRRGNLMARLRAVVLFDQSARLGALPLGTGNKSERLLGYFTWHADDTPPINPLGDLFKTQVWALARHLGVPAPILDKPASADLVRGVHDEDELGIGYHEADPILQRLVEGWTADDLVAGGWDADQVRLVAARLESTHWKRELPTVAVLSSSAIGAFYLRPVDY